MVNLRIILHGNTFEFATDAKLSEAQSLLTTLAESWFQALAPDHGSLSTLTNRLNQTSAALQAAEDADAQSHS